MTQKRENNTTKIKMNGTYQNEDLFLLSAVWS